MSARRAAALAAVLALGGCRCGGGGGDAGTDAGSDAGPPATIDELPVTATLTLPALDGTVDIVRDVYGIPHVYASTVHDVFFADGLIQAMDRFVEMHLVRLAAAGRVSEIGGALQPNLVAMDLRWRMFQFRAQAVDQWAALDPASDVAIGVQAFSDGVTAYITGLQNGDFSLPSSLALFQGLVNGLEPWTPVDTLMLSRFFFFNLSYNGDDELVATDVLQRALAAFDAADPVATPELAARAGAGLDLWRIAPADPSYILGGFPNMPVDMGTVAVSCGAFCGGRADAPARPHVPDWLAGGAAEAARVARAGLRSVTGFGGADPGSNNFVVSGALTADGMPIVANDPHLDLFNPPVLYFQHLNLDLRTGVPDTLDVAGAIFPGVPGAGMGFNRHVAWGATYAYHDMADIYLEDIVPCSAGTGDCVLFEGGEVPISTTPETFELGLLGSPTGEVTLDMETVPHHGPILPTIDASGAIVPRAMTPDPSQALSVRWTGVGPANELNAFFGLWVARDVADVETALDSFRSIAVNLVSADDAGDVFYSASASIPIRSAGAMSWDPVTNPGGTAPMFVLPGDGTAEWVPDAYIPESYVPHALDPASGYVATANNDPAGITDDDNPLNDPYYTGWSYDLGFRHGRMSTLIEAGAGAFTLDDAAAIQADDRSNLGALLAHFVPDAEALLEEELAAPGTHPDLADLAVDLAAAPGGELDVVRAAAALLASWDFETTAASAISPPTPPPTATEIAESAAASVWNAWLVRVVNRTFLDELTAMGWDPLEDVRPTHQQFGRAIAHLFLDDPATIASGLDPVTGDPILFDDLETPGFDESRDRIVLEALREAVAFLRSPPAATETDPPGGFGSDDPLDWRWGDLHALRLTFPLPSASGGPSMNDLPPAGDPTYPNGYPRHGENFTVDVGNHGLWDFDFGYGEGASMRFLCRVTPDGPEARIVLPGGEIFDAASPHYDDDALLWIRNEYHPFPFSEAEVVAAYESRLVLTPK